MRKMHVCHTCHTECKMKQMRHVCLTRCKNDTSGLTRYAKPVLKGGLIRYAKPVLKVGLIRYAKPVCVQNNAMY